MRRLFLLVFIIFVTDNLRHLRATFLATNEIAGDTKEWWQTAAFYQIYPRSFKDSNADGIGDLNGIAEKLPYLKEIGITAFWMSPIFQSPMADFGYDISNFYKIQPEYGTMDDFEALVKKAKELQLKVILDFVPNHSSDENDWFKKSVSKEKGFEDFYIWHPGRPNPDNTSRPLPPNNWVSVFRGSAWQWNDVRKEYYLHQFVAKQPDLNYRNPSVVEQMKDVLRFWLDKGVDGFRIDAVPSLFEIQADAAGNYPDEPLSGNTNDPDDYSYLNHIYTQDQNETLDMVYEWREVMDDYLKEHGGDPRIIMTESYSRIDIVMKYFGNGTQQGAQMPFNFQIIMNLHNTSNALDIKKTIDYWTDNIPAGRTSNWVMGNHDQRRVASRLGEDRIDIMNMILLSLPGASVTYNGEEIGMTDVWISYNDSVDPAACNAGPANYEKSSRDPERTPFQWDDSKDAGFSSAAKTWLPISPRYKEVNVKAQEAAPNSYLKVFKDLTTLRQTNSFRYGSLKTIAFNPEVFIIFREIRGFDTYVTLANLGNSQQKIDLSNLSNVPLVGQASYEVVSVSSKHKKGDSVAVNRVLLDPKESIVLRAKSAYYFYDIIKFIH